LDLSRKYFIFASILNICHDTKLAKTIVKRKKMDRKKDEIKEFYQSLGKGEKGRFTTWLQVRLEMSYTAIMSRLRTDGWRSLEREAIEEGIQTGEWRNLAGSLV